MYIHRHIEFVLKNVSRQFKTVLLTGPRQIGKTTVMKHLFDNTHPYVTFDDFNQLNLAKEDPMLFMKNYQKNAILLEIQYVPMLFPAIKYVVDQNEEYGKYLMTGSQAFELMRNVSESLAGRIAIVELYGLSLREKKGISFYTPFIPTKSYIEERTETIKKYEDLWYQIHRGSLPILEKRDFDWEQIYSSYLKTYIERDVRNLVNIGDEVTFSKFVIAVAARSGELLNYNSISNDIGISLNTVKKWISVLKASGLIYILEPYHHNILTRIVKTPKVYFLDTGFLSYLTRWMTSEVLRNGAKAGHVFETFVISEIIKSYTNAGKTQLPLYYYRDKDGKEIDLIIEENGALYPVEIKMTASPNKEMIKAFGVLDKIPSMKVGTGALICLIEKKMLLSEDVYALPIEYI